MDIKFLSLSLLLLSLISGLHGKDSDINKKAPTKTKSEINLEKAFDEFRAASDGINKKLLSVRSDILSYYDQSSTNPLTREISDLQSSIGNLQKTILTNKKEVSLQGILNINKRFLKLTSDWETYKKTHSTSTQSPTNGVKSDLLDLSDKIISIQFELLRFSGDLTQKEKLSSGLKELQSLVTEVLNNISNSDPTKAAEKIRLIRDTLAQLSAEWDALKNAVTPQSPTTTQASTTNNAIEDTRLGMASTIRELLNELSDLKKQISQSTIDLNQRSAYLLAIKSAEKLLQLLQIVLPKIELNAVFSRIFEVKDLIQDIIFDWNSNNPLPLTTTTSPNDPFADIKKSLNDLDSALFSFKLDALSFPGDQSLIDPFLKRNAGIQTAVNQLRNDLLYTEINKATAQSDLLQSSFRKLRDDLDAFLAADTLVSVTRLTTSPTLII